MKRFLATALLGTALVSGAAYAQTTTQPNQTPAASPSTMTAPAATAGEKINLSGNWRASKLIGLKVYNESNERLGDINELIVDKAGKINAVVIGVGGFLGMGEHDIAVSMDKLKFIEEPVRTSSAVPANSTAPAASTTTERRDTTTGTSAPATTTTMSTSTSATARASNTNDWTPDHAMMNGTKEQLKAMPQFKYSDYN